MSSHPTLLTAASDLATSSTAERFDGSAHGGGVELSFFLNHVTPGRGTAEHRHPYPEVFVIIDGEARFAVDSIPTTVRGGQVLVVPAQAIHAFHSDSSERLEMISIHPAAEMITEWIPEP